MKKLVLLTALLLASMSLQAGELVFHWNKMAESKVYDLEFYPDNNYFILCTANDIQIRNTEDGEIFKTYQFGATEIEFTPDSSKILLILTGEETGRIQLRNTSDMSLVKEYTLPADSNGLYHFFEGIAVDPKRPYFYTVTTRTGEIVPGNWFTERKILVFNYETMEVVNELIPSEPINVNKKLVAISNDGKYLSFINQGESYLKTFDLNTQKEVQSFKVCESYEGGNSGAPVCIKFSELNSDKIYFSGNFPQSDTDLEEHCGLFIYSISENKIIDSTFGVGNEKILKSIFSFFENEKKSIAISSIYLRVINYEKKNIEYKRKLDLNISISDKILYNKEKDFFIGYSSPLIGKIGYKNDTDIIEKIDIVDSVYPNPTTNEIIIKINCKQSFINYKILNINSQVLAEETTNIQDNSLSLDFSTYSTGYYFIQILCDDSVRTYKIIKEN